MDDYNIDQQYASVLKIALGGACIPNKRTGESCSVARRMLTIATDLSDGMFPLLGNRRYFPHLAAAETAWQLEGTRDPSFINLYSEKMWAPFVNDKGLVENAYGYRWRDHFEDRNVHSDKKRTVAFKRDQIKLAIREIRDNPSSRQIYVSAWDPSHDGLGTVALNVPCPVGFHIWVDTSGDGPDILHMSVFMRSCDLFIGLPYDIFNYALLLDAIAASTDTNLGTLSFALSNAHIYEKHRPLAIACLSNAGNESFKEDDPRYGSSTGWMHNRLRHNIKLPAFSVAEIEKDPEDYVEYVRRLSKRGTHNPWNPKPELTV